jgi:predicted DCC family thiol-disulfide oxidoreductase YuxK
MSRTKPTLIYDGDCNFCRRWVARWKHVTLDRVDYICSQEIGDRFPQIDRGRFESSVVFVDAKVYEGAQAVFRTLSHSPKWRWTLSLYRSLPGFSWITEAIYRLVANNRSAFSLMTSWFWGDSSEPPSYQQVRKTFLIFLGLIYLVAFGSLWGQIQGLVGSAGILPAKEFLEEIQSLTGSAQFWRAPTVFWFYISDGFLVFVCLAGLGLSVLAIFGIFQAPVFFLLWFLYLSLLTVGQKFMSFQWDTLLLEAGFLAIFFAPRETSFPFTGFRSRPVFIPVLIISGDVFFRPGKACEWRSPMARNGGIKSPL